MMHHDSETFLVSRLPLLLPLTTIFSEFISSASPLLPIRHHRLGWTVKVETNLRSGSSGVPAIVLLLS